MRVSPESWTRPSTRSTVATRTRPKLIRTSTDVFSSEASKARASYAARAGTVARRLSATAPTEEPARRIGVVVQILHGAGVVITGTERLGVDDGAAQLGEERVVVLVVLPPHVVLVVGLGGRGLGGEIAQRVVR